MRKNNLRYQIIKEVTKSGSEMPNCKVKMNQITRYQIWNQIEKDVSDQIAILHQVISELKSEFLT